MNRKNMDQKNMNQKNMNQKNIDQKNMDQKKMDQKKMDPKKKNNILRLIIQCISFAFHNGYLTGWMKGKIYTGDYKKICMPGLNCYSCPGAVGACPLGSLQAVLDGGAFRVSLYVLGAIGAIGLFCGRLVCGWLCPFGLVQDLLYKIPFVKKIKNLPGHKYLRHLRFVILALFVIILPIGVKNDAGVGQPWFCEFICPSGTLLGGIPLTIANPELGAQIGGRFIWKAALLLIILVSAVISYRPFCKYICPLGALYGCANPISIYRLKVDHDKCTGCGACKKACGMDIDVCNHPNSMDCIRCGKCMAACPAHAITSTFSGRKEGGEKTTLGTAATGTVLRVIFGLLSVGFAIYLIIDRFTDLIPRMYEATDFALYCRNGIAPTAILIVVNISLITYGIGLLVSVKKKGTISDSQMVSDLRIARKRYIAILSGALLAMLLIVFFGNVFGIVDEFGTQYSFGETVSLGLYNMLMTIGDYLKGAVGALLIVILSVFALGNSKKKAQ